MNKLKQDQYSHVSVIIPFYNEENNVEPVLAELMNKVPGCEVIAVNDGSTDRTLEKLLAVGRRSPALRVHSFMENKGKGFAVHTGLSIASNEFCILTDGDGQFDPRDIPALIKGLEAGFDLACGVRTARLDGLGRMLVSRMSNAIRRMMLGDSVADTCSMKAVRLSHSRRLLVAFEGLHRFIPSFFYNAGLRIIEIPISHRPRLYGKTKYSNTGRAIRGVADMIRLRRHLRSYA